MICSVLNITSLLSVDIIKNSVDFNTDEIKEILMLRTDFRKEQVQSILM